MVFPLFRAFQQHSNAVLGPTSSWQRNIFKFRKGCRALPEYTHYRPLAPFFCSKCHIPLTPHLFPSPCSQPPRTRIHGRGTTLDNAPACRARQQPSQQQRPLHHLRRSAVPVLWPPEGVKTLRRSQIRRLLLRYPPATNQAVLDHDIAPSRGGAGSSPKKKHDDAVVDVP